MGDDIFAELQLLVHFLIIVAENGVAAVDQAFLSDSRPIQQGNNAYALRASGEAGLAAHGAARLFAGDAKTDARDAMVIAKTALGIPDALLPVPRGDARLEAARSMAAQRNHMVTCATRDKNRLRSILLIPLP